MRLLAFPLASARLARVVMAALWLSAWVLGVPTAHAAVHVDDAGRRVSLDRPAVRVVTLAANLTEFVYAVGAGESLIATMDTSNYPPEARRVPRIGDYQRIDVERVVAMKPDLVLVWLHGNQGRELAQLEAAGLTLFYLDPRRLDDIARALERIGALLGRDAAGHAAATSWRHDLAALRERYAHVEPVSVFFQIWRQPLMTLNGQHLTSNLLSLCGGRNIFAGLTALAPQVSTESVVAANPDAIFVAREDDDARLTWRRAADATSLQGWQRFPQITAVKRSWMYALPGDLVTRQGPRALEGARAICDALDQVRAERRAVPRP